MNVEQEIKKLRLDVDYPKYTFFRDVCVKTILDSFKFVLVITFMVLILGLGLAVNDISDEPISPQEREDYIENAQGFGNLGGIAPFIFFIWRLFFYYLRNKSRREKAMEIGIR